jgi:hypothetical protein
MLEPENVIVNDTVNPDTFSSHPLAKLLAAAQLPQDKDTSHSRRDEVGFSKLFLAKASTPSPECKELSIEDGVQFLYLLEQSLSSEVELDQEEWDDSADGILNVMNTPNWNNIAAGHRGTPAVTPTRPGRVGL